MPREGQTFILQSLKCTNSATILRKEIRTQSSEASRPHALKSLDCLWSLADSEQRSRVWRLGVRVLGVALQPPPQIFKGLSVRQTG